MQDAIHSLTQWLSANPGWVTGVVFLTALLESLAMAGLLVPGVAILFAVAVLAGKAGIPVMEILAWGPQVPLSVTVSVSGWGAGCAAGCIRSGPFAATRR